MSGFSLNLGDPSTAQGFAARCKDIFGAILEHTPKLVPADTEEKSDQLIQEIPHCQKNKSVYDFKSNYISIF